MRDRGSWCCSSPSQFSASFGLSSALAGSCFSSRYRGSFVFVVVVPVLYLLLPMVLGLFGRLTTPPEDEPD
jgi:hypothetical protein